MLQPKRTKYRKQFKGRNDGLAQCSNLVSFGEYGLKATTHGALTARQIEAGTRGVPPGRLQTLGADPVCDTGGDVMASKDINNQSADELNQHLLDLRKEQFNLRMQKGSGQLTQPHQLRRVRRDIARTKFVLGSKK